MNSAVHKAVVFWSSGKDSSMALYLAKKDPELEVVGLFSTIEKASKRISFHGTPESLVKSQAESIGLPLWTVDLPQRASNEIYESIVSSALKELKQSEVTHLIFGDLFLEDIRNYREKFLAALGFNLVFPLWKKNTTELAREIISVGFKAVICAVNPLIISDRSLGCQFDSEFIDSLATKVDPCGENGEFHTFVTDGPIFKKPIELYLGPQHHDPFSHWVELLPKR